MPIRQKRCSDVILQTLVLRQPHVHHHAKCHVCIIIPHLEILTTVIMACPSRKNITCLISNDIKTPAFRKETLT